MAAERDESNDIAAWRGMVEGYQRVRGLTPDASEARMEAKLASGSPDDDEAPQPQPQPRTRPLTTHVPAVRVVREPPSEHVPLTIIDAEFSERPTDRLPNAVPHPAPLDPRIVALSRAVHAPVHAEGWTPRAVGSGAGAAGLRLHPDAWDAGTTWGWQATRLQGVLEAGTELLELARYYADTTLAALEPMGGAQTVALRDRLTVSYLIAYAHRILRAAETDPLMPFHPSGHPGLL